MTRRSRTSERIPSDVYAREYFLSEACEGFEDYRRGSLSAVKRRELELLEARPGTRVLDVGCGRGDVLAELGRRELFAVGVDYAEDALDLVREGLGPRARVARADAVALPFRSGTFDRVLLGDVIEHLPWNLAVEALEEIGRVLDPDGYLIVHTAPNRWFRRWVLPIVRRGLRLLGRGELVERLSAYEERRGVVHPNELSPVDLRRLLSEAGLVGRVWVSRDLLRSGSGPWTRELTRSPVLRLAARIAGVWPLRLVLGNDIFARVASPG